MVEKMWYDVILPINKIMGVITYPSASEASSPVYWNQAQKNFTHPYTG